MRGALVKDVKYNKETEDAKKEKSGKRPFTY